MPVQSVYPRLEPLLPLVRDRKSTRLNSSHVAISYAVFCLKNKRAGAQTGAAGAKRRASVCQGESTSVQCREVCRFAGDFCFDEKGRGVSFFFLRSPRPPRSTLFPYTSLFR